MRRRDATQGGATATLGALARDFGGQVSGDPETSVRAVTLDSRRAEDGALFAALPGLRAHGLRFVGEAARRGASAVLVNRGPDALALARSGALPAWIHPDARAALGHAAARLAGDPSHALDVVAVTGTNGKTTVAHLAGQLLDAAGRRAAVLGTAGHRLAGRDGELTASHTTPDAPELQRLLGRHLAEGGDSVVMEASSHALVQERLAGTRLRAAAFTNLSRDHLDYHGTLERYARAKARLFTALGADGVAVLNAEDEWWESMASAATARGASVLTYAVGRRADLVASQLAPVPRGVRLRLAGLGLDGELLLPLRGRYNVENALAAAALARAVGAPAAAVRAGLERCHTAPGRLEEVTSEGDGVRVLVDYAHSPDALERVLSTLREELDAAGTAGRLLVVFGCGGDRDVGKRPLMGAVAARLADVSIVTSDNPRDERPEAIAEAVLGGLDAVGGRRLVELDRRRAIARALEIARPGDVVLVAGKGHENTQQIGQAVMPFDDRVVALEVLGARASHGGGAR